MCGIIDDAFSFVKDSVGELFNHPFQALGAAFGVPGYDPFFGGLFNNGPGGALISPTGNFTSGAWQDMYQDNPGDSGALGLFSGINSVADKVAPAIAGMYAGPALTGAMGGTGDGASFAGDFSSSGTTSMGGLEAGTGGGAMWGPAAGTGTAMGPGTATAMGAGNMGIAGPSSLEGVGSSAGQFSGGLGGGTQGTGIGAGSVPDLNATVQQNALASGASPVSATGATGNAPMADMSNSLQMGMSSGDNGALQAAAASPNSVAPATTGSDAASQAMPGTQGLSSLYGPESTATGSPMGQTFGNTSQYGFNNVQAGALGQPTAGGNMDLSSLADLYKQISPWMNLAKSGLGAYQQFRQQQAQNNYANQINNEFSPNSPYAQQMMQSLARQDAAAGRNSQYGNRAVQLAAELTKARANALGNNNYYQAATATPGASMLNSLFYNFANPQGMQGLMQAGSAGLNSLSSLFGG